MDSMIQDLINVIEELGGRFHGIYTGYGMHQGVALTLSGMNEMFMLGAAMAQYDSLVELTMKSPTVDTLGTGIIVSFPMHLFDTADIDDIRNGVYDQGDEDDYEW